MSSDEIYATYLQEEKIKNIITQISPSNALVEIEMRLKGKRKDHITNRWIDGVNPRIDDKIIENYISYLSSFMNENLTLGNLSPQQIARIMKCVVEYITDDLDTHGEDYNIGEYMETLDEVYDMRTKRYTRFKRKVFMPNYTERTRIGHIMLNSTFFVLLRSLNGIEARRFWSSLTMSDSLGGMPQQKNKDWWKIWK